ncbi:MAG: NAD(P)H-dependent oxidoreductase subunit E [Chloroflexota bacterium]|nr:NAD(P)H-dependent oxidoreductase subunit E [Chloroflexota bacterium]
MNRQMEIDLTKIDPVIDKYQGDRGLLISLLQDIQEVYNYLPEEALLKVSEALDIPKSQVFSVATFFKAFSLEPRGQHLVTVCLGTACHVRGGQRMVEKLERDLDIKAGETTEDFSFTLETVNCLGCCALGPVLVVDGKYESRVDSAKLDQIIKRYR